MNRARLARASTGRWTGCQRRRRPHRATASCRAPGRRRRSSSRLPRTLLRTCRRASKSPRRCSRANTRLATNAPTNVPAPASPKQRTSGRPAFFKSARREDERMTSTIAYGTAYVLIAEWTSEVCGITPTFARKIPRSVQTTAELIFCIERRIGSRGASRTPTTRNMKARSATGSWMRVVFTGTAELRDRSGANPSAATRARVGPPRRAA